LKYNTLCKKTQYADLRWGNGDVFSYAGFIDKGITIPDYWWTDFRNRISRYKVQKRPKGVSEREYCESLGLKKFMELDIVNGYGTNNPSEEGSSS